ncbi:MAG: cytochrome c biogenesis protein CcsA [Opitutae bacterium]|nr:cytochrome c biogenesis protein CcsA [Opitutae bacterium]
MFALLTDRQWLWIAAGCYLTGVLFGTISLARHRRHSRVAMYAIIVAGYLAQTFGLLMRGRAVGGCPLGNAFEIFQFTGWSATALYLAIGATFRLSLFGYFTACLTLVFTLVSLNIPAWDAVRHTALLGGNPWIAVHAALAMFSYGVFALLTLSAAMFLFRNHSLKSKQPGGWFHFLPSVLDLDHMSVRLLTAGVSVMTLAIGVGWVYWRRDDAEVDHMKLLIVVAVWWAYVLTLVLRLAGRLTGKYFAWMCVAMFGLALLSLWPVNRSRHPEPRVRAAVSAPAP